MIELTQWSKPHQIPLPYGLAVTVQPLNTSGMAAAQAAARRSVEAVERRARWAQGSRTATGRLARPLGRGRPGWLPPSPAHPGARGPAAVHAPPSAAERRKKRISALCRWHFQPDGGPEYCRACRDDDLPCARAEPGSDGRLCPYREHALISRQEHEAWDVVLGCQGQLRLARSEYVVGIDMHAALKLAAARGCDLPVLSRAAAGGRGGLCRGVVDRPRSE